MRLLIGNLAFEVTFDFLDDLRQQSNKEFPLAQVALALHSRAMRIHSWYGDSMAPAWQSQHWDHVLTFAHLSDNMLMDLEGTTDRVLFREGEIPLQLLIEQKLIMERVRDYVRMQNSFRRLFPSYQADIDALITLINDRSEPLVAEAVSKAQDWLISVSATRDNITQLVLVLVS